MVISQLGEAPVRGHGHTDGLSLPAFYLLFPDGFPLELSPNKAGEVTETWLGAG